MLVLAKDEEVFPRLKTLGITKSWLLDVVRAAVGARRNATPFHPLGAGGLLAWLEGSTHLRRVFIREGWMICRRDNIETVFNPQTGIKLVYQNAKRAGDPNFDPIASCKKGAASARAIDQGQYEMFPEFKEQEIKEINATTWCLFVYADGEDVRAELSCPKTISEDQYKGFHERIILIQRGEWHGPDLSEDQMPPLDFDIVVTPKK